MKKDIFFDRKGMVACGQILSPVVAKATRMSPVVDTAFPILEGKYLRDVASINVCLLFMLNLFDVDVKTPAPPLPWLNTTGCRNRLFSPFEDGKSP